MKVVPISARVKTPEIVPNSLLAQPPGTELFKNKQNVDSISLKILYKIVILTKCCTTS